MGNQLGNNNSEQRLIGGTRAAAPVREAPRRARSGEAFVANNNEKRYHRFQKIS